MGDKFIKNRDHCNSVVQDFSEMNPILVIFKQYLVRFNKFNIVQSP